MEDKKSSLGRVVDKTTGTVSQVSNQMAQSQVVSATKERASAVGNKARAATVGQLQLATREDIVRLEDSLERLEAAVADLSARLPEKPKPRARKPKDEAEEA